MAPVYARNTMRARALLTKGGSHAAFLHARGAHRNDLQSAMTRWGSVAQQGLSPWDGFIGTGLLSRRTWAEAGVCTGDRAYPVMPGLGQVSRNQ